MIVTVLLLRKNILLRRKIFFAHNFENAAILLLAKQDNGTGTDCSFSFLCKMLRSSKFPLEGQIFLPQETKSSEQNIVLFEEHMIVNSSCLEKKYSFREEYIPLTQLFKCCHFTVCLARYVYWQCCTLSYFS